MANLETDLVCTRRKDPIHGPWSWPKFDLVEVLCRVCTVYTLKGRSSELKTTPLQRTDITRQ